MSRHCNLRLNRSRENGNIDIQVSGDVDVVAGTYRRNLRSAYDDDGRLYAQIGHGGFNADCRVVAPDDRQVGAGAADHSTHAADSTFSQMSGGPAWEQDADYPHVVGASDDDVPGASRRPFIQGCHTGPKGGCRVRWRCGTPAVEIASRAGSV